MTSALQMDLDANTVRDGLAAAGAYIVITGGQLQKSTSGAMTLSVNVEAFRSAALFQAGRGSVWQATFAIDPSSLLTSLYNKALTLPLFAGATAVP